MKALIIKKPWIDLILDGKKIWEIRGSNTKIRGKIELIQSGSGLIVCKCEIKDCIKLDLNLYQNNLDKHCIKETTCLPYHNTYAWVLQNPQKYDNPIPYKHPMGAVIWVKL